MSSDRFAWVWEEVSSSLHKRARPDVDELWHGNEAHGHVHLLTAGRRMFLLGFPLLILGLLLVRLGYLQFRQSDLYSTLVEQNQFRLVSVPAPRGVIVDRTGKELVTNVPNFTLAVIPAAIPRAASAQTSFYDRLSKLTNKGRNEIEDLLENRKYSRADAIPVWPHIPYQRALALSVEAAELPGVTVEAYPTRSYVAGPAAAPIVGYIGAVAEAELKSNPKLLLTDEVGKTGLEWRYNDLLMGEPGFVAYERTGQNTFLSPVKKRDPVPGKTLRLTIDGELQQRLYDRLLAQVLRSRSSGGAAVAIDPKNGQVLALVSVPTFDSNWFIDPAKRAQASDAVVNPKRLLLNRAVSGQYPSGSIIKPILGVAALAERIITPTTTVLSVGGFRIGPNLFPDWKAGGHGVTNLSKAIAESVNTFFYAVGGGYENQVGLGVERIVRYLSLFGWGAMLGIDLPNEADGFLPTKQWRENGRATPWRLGDTYHLSIGQGDLDVTPLQVAMSTAAIANGGTLYKPQLVDQVIGPSGVVLQQTEAESLRQNIASVAAIRSVRAGMREGVLSGSSRSLQDLPVPAAGKTGTAQFGNKGKTHSWFTSFAPYDQPSIVLTVIVEGGGEGNDAALPVAHDVLKWYFQR